MVRFEVQCACGHRVVTSLALPEGDAPARFPSYIGKAACPACSVDATNWRDSRSARRVAAAGRQWQALGPLRGSAFQTVWASDIRDEHLRQFARWTADFDESARAVMHREMVDLVGRRSDAGWWIDHRDNTFLALLPDCSAAIRKLVISAAFASAGAGQDLAIHRRRASRLGRSAHRHASRRASRQSLSSIAQL